MLSWLQQTFLFVVPFLIVLTVVVTVHELGHFSVAKLFGVAIDRFSIGFGKALLHWTDKSGVQWRIGALPLGGYVRFAGDAEASSSVPDEDHLVALRRDIALKEGVGAEQKYFQFKPVWQRALITAAGPFANFLLSTLIFSVLLFSFGEYVLKPTIGVVQPGSAAARAGFQRGDVVTALDGRPIDSFSTLEQYVVIRPGEPIRFDVQRGAGHLQITAAPDYKDKTIALTGGVKKSGVLGISPAGGRENVSHKTYGPVEAVAGGVAKCADIIGTTVTYLGRVVTGRTPANQLGGLIGIAAATKGAVQEGAAGAPDVGHMVAGSALMLVQLAAFISVGIGFINLLPIPVLDGGHLVFYAYEAAARRPVAAKVQALGYRVGLALLAGLMLFAAFNDLQQFSVFKLLGGLFS